MSEDKSGFVVHYRSARALKRDHETQISKGGLIVPWRSKVPEPNRAILLRVQTPDGTSFDLSARTGDPVRGKGFVVLIELDPATKGRAPIDLFMRGDRMRRLIEAEKPDAAADAEVRATGAMALALGVTSDVPAPAAELDPDTDAVSAPELEEPEPEQASSDEEGGAEDDGSNEIMPAGFHKPGPGDSYLVYIVKFTTVREFAAVRDKFRSSQRFELKYPEEKENLGKCAQLRITLPGHNVFQMFGAIEKIAGELTVLAFDENNEKFRVACNYVDTPPARARIQNEGNMPIAAPVVVRMVERVPEEDDEKMPIRRRLARMGMDDKINMALSGGREERMALAMDSNKAIHHFLLRNAKISLDEVAFMARLPTMNPDVLDKIAENPQYTQNPSVVKALVYNPKTPITTAVRLLDRLPRPEVMNLAKRMNMNLRLVMAAKKKLERGVK